RDWSSDVCSSDLVVDTPVLDRSRDERGDGDQELGLGVRELARRLGVQRDRRDGRTGLVEDRHRYKRLEPLLLQFRDVLEARVRDGVLPDQDRLAVLQGPPGDALTTLERDLSDELLVR